MQTLKALHENAHLAHLDVSCETVMLHPGAHPWDCVRLVGFSAAQRCSPGTVFPTCLQQVLFASQSAYVLSACLIPVAHVHACFE